MSDPVIPVGILIYLGVRYLIASSRDSAQKEKELVAKRSVTSKQIRYYSNGVLVNVPLHIHYIMVLDIFEHYGVINRNMICEAANQSFQMLDTSNVIYHKSAIDIMAAEKILTEQHDYILSFN